MAVLVTGSSGHLGEALMRLLPETAVGLDLKPGTCTAHVGSITDRSLVRRALAGVEAVIHTATLHKPHVATHSKADFVETNITGTLVLLEEAQAAGITRFIFTSTTSAFGAALRPGPQDPAVWIDETVVPVPKNIYGATKTAAEDLAQLFCRQGMGVVVLRTSRFFPEPDDNPEMRAAYADANAKANEFLFRRVDLEDAATAHIAALARATPGQFDRFVISATSPFQPSDLTELRTDPARVIARSYPRFPEIYAQAGYTMFPEIGRVYSNQAARAALDWSPVYDFGRILAQIEAGTPIGSPLAQRLGVKGYHEDVFTDGLYPVE